MQGGKQPVQGHGSARLGAVRLDPRRRPSSLGCPHARVVACNSTWTRLGRSLDHDSTSPRQSSTDELRFTHVPSVVPSYHLTGGASPGRR
ncbi:hypothetical protein NDU88_006521 [Pleurodeles waltl]|uniref:Uncharacterized protein n=1 Tax=Pleurodeles waltl TaxID=8319 RepID=A0AAV7N3Q3_PLEWA|nr:hypothetical protein NDU88_006521 [Pleurodeles waltl]